MGTGDHHCHEGQRRICCDKARDKHDTIIVQEKLDGSCCAVANVCGAILPLGRAGYLANTSPYRQHHMFYEWALNNASRFKFLADGEWCCGEWMGQAVGTKYRLPHEPFVLFDWFIGGARATQCQLLKVTGTYGFTTPQVIASGPTSISRARGLIRTSHHGALEDVEGAVWRVERKGKVDFLAKWVRPDKEDGKYLPKRDGSGEFILNEYSWRP